MAQSHPHIAVLFHLIKDRRLNIFKNLPQMSSHEYLNYGTKDLKKEYPGLERCLQRLRGPLVGQ